MPENTEEPPPSYQEEDYPPPAYTPECGWILKL